MVVEGLIVNGRVEIATALPFPEGTKVFVGTTDEELLLPFESPDESTLQSLLRQSIDEMNHGERGLELDEFMDDLTQKYGLTASPNGVHK